MIKLSRLTDYAVTLLTQMVSGEQALWSASDLTEKSGLSLATTSKILKQLTKSGIISAQRGASGGYHLNKDPAHISIACIIEAMDGPIALTNCATGGDQNCTVEKLCPMSGNWDRINKAVRRALEEVSLADMASSPPLARVGAMQKNHRGGLVKQEAPSPAKTKDLAEAKPKFSLPLPQGERF